MVDVVEGLGEVRVGPGAPMWRAKRLWVDVLMVVGCRGCCCGSWRAGSGYGGGPGRGRPGCDVSLVGVCAGSRTGRRGRSQGGEGGQEHCQASGFVEAGLSGAGGFLL